MHYRIHGLTKTPLFWIIFLFIFVTGIWFSLHFFSKAFPIIDLDITMDRRTALEAAQDIAQKYHWGPQDFKQAASFEVDNETKNFIELEGGGLTRFKEILHDPDYSPYTWSVRNFKEYEINEVTIAFTPEGNLYGFQETIAEDKLGPALSADQARAIAIAHATNEWNIDFTHFATAETSQEIRPNGRIDHIFVYERTDKKVGSAPYRLTLGVTGNTFTQLKHSIQVPESFKRRYQEMRSSNNIIAFIALIAVILLYVFGGFIALFFLLRAGWLLWKVPLLFGIIIGLLQGMVIFNELPLYWKVYPTSLSLQNFIGQILLQIFITICGFCAVATLICMLAESLSRKAFGHHIQLWRVWGKTAGHSLQVIGRTFGGYLILGFKFAFAIGLYYITLRYFGWWSPSEELYNPNILAHYLPWLSPLVLSFSAGFLEECLFRALPLSCAALLGNRFGKRTLWITVAFVLQAIIFGAAHANYPAQPAYARLVELIIPSFIFGGIYLQFGLLPSIITHYVYDVVWFSLPIFIASTQGIIINKIIIILGMLLPLLVIIFRMLQARKITTLPSYFYNKTWQPTIEDTIIEQPTPEIAIKPIKNNYRIMLYGIGTLALLIWIVTTQFYYDGVPIALTRSQAVNLAKNIVNETSTSWTILSDVILTEPSQEKEQKIQHLYAWQTTGKDGYQQLLSEQYLKPYTWFIRFVHFEGDVIQRTEEHQVSLRTPDTLFEKKHIYAESLALPSLSREDAHKKVQEVVLTTFNLDINNLTEVSASPKKQPERTDWTFIYDVPSTVNIAEGKQRITISLAGDQVSDAYRSLFVPETWKRNYTEQRAFDGILSTLSDFIFILIIICALALFATQINFRAFSWHTFFIFFGIVFIKSLIQAYNIWPTTEIHFSTIEPFYHQVWKMLLLWLIVALAKSVCIGILAATIVPIIIKSPQFNYNFISRIIFASSIGTLVAAVYSLIIYVSPAIVPLWPDFMPAGAYMPALSAALHNITFFIETMMIFIVLVIAADVLTNGWHQRKPFFVLIAFLLGLAFMGHNIESLPFFYCLTAGVLFGLLACLSYIYVLRFDKVMLAFPIAAYMILHSVQQMFFNAYPGAILGGVLSIILIMIIMVVWMQLQRNRQANA